MGGEGRQGRGRCHDDRTRPILAIQRSPSCCRFPGTRRYWARCTANLHIVHGFRRRRRGVERPCAKAKALIEYCAAQQAAEVVRAQGLDQA